MEIGNKIKRLRSKSGLTQEQLANKLGISAQSVSKWENSVTMPDIVLLPTLAGELGVSIDELFDLTNEQKKHRIEQRIDREEDLSTDTFKEYEDFLNNLITENNRDPKVLGLLARLYHHRMESDSKRISKYARESIMRAPEVKSCQWLLQKAEGQVSWDWNVANHASVIDFYKNVIENDMGTPKTPLPYYYLLDNLIADHRTKEAYDYLERYKLLPAHKPFMISVYKAHIALAEYDEVKADKIISDALEEYSCDAGFLFEAAQYYARKCEYDKAIDCYEGSWKIEAENKPRYTDTLEGIATIYEILGKKDKAISVYDRIIDCLKTEWGYSSDDIAVIETERKIQRLLL